MKFAIGQLVHETNTFASGKTDEAVFRQLEWLHGEEILREHTGVRSYIGGMIDKSKELGVELLPTVSAVAYPSGIIEEQTWERLKQELIAGIREVGEVDGICLSLHGAGVAEHREQIEEDLMLSLREAFGYDVPIAAALDLHGNLNEAFVQASDILLGVKLYPHTDEYDRGADIIQRMVELVNGSIQPVMHLERIPLLVPTSTTNHGPAREINELCREWEAKPGILDCTFFHGFPYTDTPYVGASVLVVADGDKQLAQEAAKAVARQIWERRDSFAHRHPTPAEGIRIGLATPGQPVVLNETSDNPGAGTPGDGTFLLAALLEANQPKTCFGKLYDPEAARLAHEAGVGATIRLRLGGKTDERHGKPLVVEAYVKVLTDGEFVRSSPMGAGALIRMGPSARLVIGNVDVIVCSNRAQVMDDEIFRLHGIQTERYKLVCLKSSQHFRAFFESRAARIVTVDSPGLSTMDVTTFGYEKVPRPVYPLDVHMEWNN
ncbi:MAG: M81 family metallopeptidase [Clostridia bacterium]